jgi:hypothetical protein
MWSKESGAGDCVLDERDVDAWQVAVMSTSLIGELRRVFTGAVV